MSVVSKSQEQKLGTCESLGWPHTEPLTAEQLECMVNRFLGWPLSKDFNPDAGISFKPHPTGLGPTGTNLVKRSDVVAVLNPE